ncbi:hypothetical protein [Fusobacterium ulcerans]|uniref:hypothetical protein n=1 Tax=Fusobacterium ulcerans TaxID=861 RepID=UPI00103072B3|nr:hypothetical protein [Fusobacterium ulcerans]
MVLIDSLIIELAQQDKIVFYKDSDMKKKHTCNESAEILMNILNERDDEEYEQFLNNLRETLLDL